MKKILLTMAFVLTALGNAWADEHNFWAHDITIPSGNSATLEIELTNAVDEFKQMFQFELVLPEGVTVVPGSAKLNEDRFVYNDGTGNVVRAGISTNKVDGHDKFVIEAGAANYPAGHTYAGKPVLINGTNGVVMTIKLQTTLEQSSTPLTGYLRNIEVPYRESVGENSAMKITENEFTITIGEPLDVIVLDETSEIEPSKSGKAVDVEVRRTIAPNVWSTLCLPFNMSAAEVKEAFGDDVELAELTGWSYKGGVLAGDLIQVESINLEFSSITSIAANNPILIKINGTTKPDGISSFIVKNVEITPLASIEKEVVFNNSGVPCKGIMKATYRKRKVPTNHIFLNNEIFYRAQSSTTNVKGYRGYFLFNGKVYNEDDDEWIEKKLIIDENSSSRITMSFIDDATKIKAVRASEDDGSIYNLSGQKVERLNKKGLYIKGGKKVVIK